MKLLVRRVLASTVFVLLVTWLVPAAAHARIVLNHNETLLRSR